MLFGGQVVAHAACLPPSPPPPPFSTSVMDPKEQQGHYSLAPATWQELPEWGWVQRQTALGTPTPDFSRGLLLKPFPKKGNCKATVIIARWPRLALQNLRLLTDLVLTSIWVSNHPPHNLPCERWWGCRFSRRLLDPEAGSTGLQVISSKSIRPDLTTALNYQANSTLQLEKHYITLQTIYYWWISIELICKQHTTIRATFNYSANKTLQLEQRSITMLTTQHCLK